MRDIAIRKDYITSTSGANLFLKSKKLVYKLCSVPLTTIYFLL